MDSIVNRLKEYLAYKGVSTSAAEIEINVSNGTLSKPFNAGTNIKTNTLEKFLSNYKDIDPAWLLTGIGKMIKENEEYNTDQMLYKSKHMHIEPHSSNTVPLYDLEATAGVLEVFNSNHQNIPIDHITIPNLPKCDGALYIRGDSMYPLLKSGDIVAYKIIQDKHNIIWGEMYLIYISHNGDEYFFCKFLKKSSKDGYAELISHNQHHQTVEFPLESIQALAMVKASVRFNTLI
ncbi:LexA family transcriptional regulator [Elizabethkingia anophelis]|nr:LexA family transcriptional regulator [Elizabethkingia anophelis]